MTPLKPPPEGDWKKMKLPGFASLIGPIWSKKENDTWIYGLQTTNEHANGIGIIHGGLIASLADQSMSVAAWVDAKKAPVATIQLDLRFLTAAKPGDFIEVMSQVRHVSKSIIFVEATLTVSDKQIAIASGVWKILNTK